MIFNEMYLKLTPFHKVDPVIYGIRRLALYYYTLEKIEEEFCVTMTFLGHSIVENECKALFSVDTFLFVLQFCIPATKAYDHNSLGRFEEYIKVEKFALFLCKVIAAALLVSLGIVN